nr:copia protein [Tanacetum cinerariifolium]
MKSPLHKIEDNVMTPVNEDTTVHENQTVRDDDTLSSQQSPNVDTEEQIQKENLRRGHRKDSNVAKSPFGLARGCVFQDPQQHRRLELEAAIKVVRFFKREPKTRIWTHGLNNGRTKWLKGILKNLGKDHPQPMLLYCDGHAALLISRNPRFHKRTTHIEVDCYYIRDEIVCENLDAGHVPTEEQVADFLHKAL